MAIKQVCGGLAVESLTHWQTTIMRTSYIIHTNVHYLQDQMTGRPSSPVLSEILDLPGTCPNEGEARQEETEGRGK